MSTVWSEAEDRKIARMWCAEEPPKSTREIADHLEKSKSSVYRRIKSLGLVGHKGDRRKYEELTGVALDPVMKPVRVDLPDWEAPERSETEFSTLVWGDAHFPLQDDAAISILYQITEELQPKELVCLGDIFDMFEISSFPPAPSKEWDELDIQTNTIEPGVQHLAKMMELARPDRAVFLGGNHEARWRRLLQKTQKDVKMRALLNIPKIRESLQFEEIVGFEDLGYEYVPHRDTDSMIMLRDLLVIAHGHRNNKYAARYMMQDYGKSVIFGDTHRIQSYTHRDLKGQEAGWNIGCLCTDQHYRNVNVECQGFAVVEWKKFDGEWIFNVEQVRIHDGRAIWRDNAYTA